MIRSSQDAVFNRTDRADIPVSHIRRKVETGCVRFGGLHRGEWSEHLSASELAAAVLYVDIQSLLLLHRSQVEEVEPVFNAGWKGLQIAAPAELTSGDYRVTMQITIALRSDQPQAGRILARSSEIVLVEGPDGSGSHGGPSLLKVRPAVDNIAELSKLEISEMEGPVLYVNKNISNLSWKELASDPMFKFSVFSGCVREILCYLVFNPESCGTWGAAWLALDGIKGREVVEIDGLGPHDAWIQANEFADEACEALLHHLEFATRFAQAVAMQEGA